MPSLTADALIVLAHGSPDPQWLRPIEATAERIRGRVAADTPVLVATLEHGPSLADAVQRLRTSGHSRLLVLPLFLSPGGRHVQRDVPAMVNELQKANPDLALRLVPGALGAEDSVLDALADAAVRHAADTHDL